LRKRRMRTGGFIVNDRDGNGTSHRVEGGKIKKNRASCTKSGGMLVRVLSEKEASARETKQKDQSPAHSRREERTPIKKKKN